MTKFFFNSLEYQNTLSSHTNGICLTIYYLEGTKNGPLSPLYHASVSNQRVKIVQKHSHIHKKKIFSSNPLQLMTSTNFIKEQSALFLSLSEQDKYAIQLSLIANTSKFIRGFIIGSLISFDKHFNMVHFILFPLLPSLYSTRCIIFEETSRIFLFF